MDVEYPYADSLSRRQLLYRLPTAPAPRRLLILGEEAQGALIGSAWGGPVTTLARESVDTALEQGESRFDAVALPGARNPGEPLLRAAHCLLVPGGIVVGHLDNMLAVQRLSRFRGIADLAGMALGRDAMHSARGCRRALRAAGFSEPECYYVQPSLDSPMGLIPCEPVAARAYFLRAIRAARGNYSRPAYAVRWAVAALGLGGMQQPELFFWATKPC